MIGDFHFLRPWWLLAILPAAALLIALARRNDVTHAWRSIVAPHLLPHLLDAPDRQRYRLAPIHLLAASAAIGILSLAGPSWTKEPAPFARDAAALAVVVRVAPTMATADIEPTRLIRSVQKIQDLLAQRGSAKTSLIAYSGSAHQVMPATTDAAIINTFAAALDPKIMPVEGDDAADALALATKSLGAEGGSILWITDSIAPEQTYAPNVWRKSNGIPIQILAPLPAGPELEALQRAGQSIDASITAITPGPEDITRLAHASRFTNAASPDAGAQWQDAGYYGLPILALLVLPFFRRGFLISAVAR